MAFRYSTKLFNDFLTTMKTDLAAGVIQFYSGSQPTSADAAITGTLIGTTTLAGGSWTAGTSTNGLNFATAASATIDKATAEEWRFTCTTAGTIGWGRFIGNPVDSGGVSVVLPRIDFSVGISSGDCQMAKVTYAVGETGVIQTFTVPLTNLS